MKAESICGRWSTLPFTLPLSTWRMALGFSFRTGDDFLAGSAYIVNCMITMLHFAFPGCQESDLAFRNPCHVTAHGALHADCGCPARLLPTVPLFWATLLWCQEGTSVGEVADWDSANSISLFFFFCKMWKLLIPFLLSDITSFLRKSNCRVTFWKLSTWEALGAALVGLRHGGSNASYQSLPSKPQK